MDLDSVQLERSMHLTYVNTMDLQVMVGIPGESAQSAVGPSDM